MNNQYFVVPVFDSVLYFVYSSIGNTNPKREKIIYIIDTLGELIILYVIIISSDIGIYYVRTTNMTLYEAQQADNYDEVDGIEIEGK